ADVLGFEQEERDSNEDLIAESADRRVGPDGVPGLPGAGDQPVGPAAADVSGRPFSSYFSGNTIQICPVGALTNSAYRFRSRPFDLISTPALLNTTLAAPPFAWIIVRVRCCVAKLARMLPSMKSGFLIRTALRSRGSGP